MVSADRWSHHVPAMFEPALCFGMHSSEIGSHQIRTRLRGSSDYLIELDCFGR